MSKFFMDRYAMSELGANNLKKQYFHVQYLIS